MLPTIGLMVAAVGAMIGFYIITKMVDLAAQADVWGGVQVLAAITVVAAAGGIVVLAMGAGDLVSAAESTREVLESVEY